MNIADLKHTPLLRRVQRRISRARLPFALALAIGVTLILTVISTSMYYMAGFYRYDLSRPGYEAERKAVVRSTTPKSFDTTSPITSATLDEFITEFDKQTAEIKAYNDFRDPALSDDELTISRNAAPQ